MYRLETIEQLAEDRAGFTGGQRLLDCQDLGQGAALYEFHGIKADAALTAHGVNGYQVRMFNPGKRARFLVEPAPEDGVAAQFGGQDLHGHFSIEHRIVRPIHGRHAAGADGLAQMVASEFSSW